MGVLWNFFLTSLLLTNAVCILHEKRFLKPCTYCCCCCVHAVAVYSAIGFVTTPSEMLRRASGSMAIARDFCVTSRADVYWCCLVWL